MSRAPLSHQLLSVLEPALSNEHILYYQILSLLLAVNKTDFTKTNREVPSWNLSGQNLVLLQIRLYAKTIISKHKRHLFNLWLLSV